MYSLLDCFPYSSGFCLQGHVLSGPFPGCLTVTLRTSARGLQHGPRLRTPLPQSGIHMVILCAVRTPGRKGIANLCSASWRSEAGEGSDRCCNRGWGVLSLPSSHTCWGIRTLLRVGLPQLLRDHPGPGPDHHAHSRSVLWAVCSSVPSSTPGARSSSGFIPEKPDPSSNDSLRTPEGTFPVLDTPSQRQSFNCFSHTVCRSFSILVITWRHHLT